MSVTFNIGQQNAQNIYNVAGDLNITAQSSADDVVKIFDALAAKMNELGLPEKDLKKAQNRLEEAKDELKEKEPDKKSIAKSLEETAVVLKNTKTAADQLKELLPFAAKAGAWLGKTAVELGWIF